MKKIITIVAIVIAVLLMAVGGAFLVARAKAQSIAKPYAAMFLTERPQAHLVLRLDDRCVCAWDFAYMLKDVAFPEDFPPSLLVSWRGEVLQRDRLFTIEPKDLPNQALHGTSEGAAPGVP